MRPGAPRTPWRPTTALGGQRARAPPARPAPARGREPPRRRPSRPGHPPRQRTGPCGRRETPRQVLPWPVLPWCEADPSTTDERSGMMAALTDVPPAIGECLTEDTIQGFADGRLDAAAV